jgi:hypothetical protein
MRAVRMATHRGLPLTFTQPRFAELHRQPGGENSTAGTPFATKNRSGRYLLQRQSFEDFHLYHRSQLRIYSGEVRQQGPDDVQVSRFEN